MALIAGTVWHKRGPIGPHAGFLETTMSETVGK
jgi:hypothetical protein